MVVLDDPDRLFVTSAFVRLEVLPKARYHKNHDESAFYEAFFDGAEATVVASQDLVANAQQEAELGGLAAIDALQVAAAKEGSADELVTAEKPTKTIFRTDSIPVRTIRPV